jgi:uncharacterized membrane protein
LTLWISEQTGLADNLLHLHAGLAIFVLAQLITRRPYHSFTPFLWVAFAEAGNEILDYFMASGWPADTYEDIANTLFWPFIISFTARLARHVSKINKAEPVNLP